MIKLFEIIFSEYFVRASNNLNNNIARDNDLK